MVDLGRGCVAAILVLACSHAASGDLPSVRFDRLKPLGAAAGSTVEAEIQGADIEGVESLLFDHPGLKAEFVSERKFKITVADDTPAGTYDVYLVGRFGVSNPRLFAVTHGLRDTAEQNEPNHTPETAQPVEINGAINGTLNGNADDMFRFTALRGQRVAIDCQAARLDSDMDGVLTLTSTSGKLLATNSDYYGSDPFLDFVAPEDGEYLVSLHDLSYRGGYPYRLVITNQPHVENVFPRAVQAGAAVEFTALGRNLGPDAEPTPWKVEELPLEQVRFSVAAPAEVVDLGAFRFRDHPTHHSVLPTAATCTLRGFQVCPDSAAGLLNAQPVLVTDAPVVLEAEPNDDRDQPQSLALPATVSGRFDQPRDADWYQFEVPENGQYAFDVYSERIAGRADPYVAVIDDQGNRVTELDDFGHRMNAFDGHLRDPSGMVGLSAGRKYRVLVQDRYRRGGARYQYVLEIRKPLPDFFVAAIHSSNPNPGGTTVRQGSAAYLDIVIHQRGGYNGPVTITAENLPSGLHAAPTVIENNTRGVLVLWADEDAPLWTGMIDLVATGERDGQSFRREIRPYTRVWNNAGTSRPQRRLAVAIRERAPFGLAWEADKASVAAGQTAEVKLKVARLWPEFTDKVTIQALSFPGQFQLDNFDIAAGQSEAVAKFHVQPNTRPGVYTLAVVGQGQVPFHKDPAAADKPKTLVALPSRPLTITVSAAK